MNELVIDKPGDYPYVWHYLNQRAKVGWSSDLVSIGLVNSDKKIVAAVGFNNWFTGGCYMHMAVDHRHAATRKFLAAAFHYPFVELQLDLVLGMTPAYNTRALNLNRKLGFVPFRDLGDTILQELRREDCRFLTARYQAESVHGRKLLTDTGTS